MSLVLSLIPLLTVGQYGTLTLNVNGQTDVSVGAAMCGKNLDGTYALMLTSGYPCSAFQLWVTDGECTDSYNAANGDLLVKEVAQTSVTRTMTETVQIPVSSLPYFKKNQADGGAQCGASGIDVKHKWCGSVAAGYDAFCVTKPFVKPLTPVTIHYDTLAPGQPSVTAEALDSSAALTITSDSDVDHLDIYFRVAGSTDDAGTPLDLDYAKTVSRSMSSTTLDNLVNGTTYEVGVVAFDGAGNESVGSELTTVTPIQTVGFWGECRQLHCGTGCNAAAAGPLALAMLVSLLLVRRLRR